MALLLSHHSTPTGKSAVLYQPSRSEAVPPKHLIATAVEQKTMSLENVMAERTFKPNQQMASAARRGLRLRKKFGRGGTEVGVGRAHQLAARADLNETDVKSMHSYFARHAVDREASVHSWNSDVDPSAGFIAWLLWGGDPGKKWADAKAKALT